MPDFSGTLALPKQVPASEATSDPSMEIKPADDATLDDNDATPLPSLGETSAPKYQPVSFQDHAAELRAMGVSWDEITDYLKGFFPATPKFTLPDVTVRPEDKGDPDEMVNQKPHDWRNLDPKQMIPVPKNVGPGTQDRNMAIPPKALPTLVNPPRNI